MVDPLREPRPVENAILPIISLKSTVLFAMSRFILGNVRFGEDKNIGIIRYTVVEHVSIVGKEMD